MTSSPQRTRPRRPMAAHRDAGPLLASEAAGIVTFVAGLIGLGGLFSLLSLVVIVVSRFTSATAPPLTAPVVAFIAVTAAINVCYCLVAYWLHEGRRRGAVLAIAAMALNLALLVLSPNPIDLFDLLLPLASIIGVTLSRNHLSDEGRQIDAPLRMAPAATRATRRPAPPTAPPTPPPSSPA